MRFGVQTFTYDMLDMKTKCFCDSEISFLFGLNPVEYQTCMCFLLFALIVIISHNLATLDS